MTQQVVNLPEIGEVLLAKRRGASHIRLSVTPAGKVRVSMPQWAPYAAGISFAKSRTDWIIQHLEGHRTSVLQEGDLIGKSHRLYFKTDPNLTAVTSRISPTTIEISSALPASDKKVQDKVIQTSQRALKQEAQHLLPQRLNQLAKKYGYTYNRVLIRKLTSRWGSCSSTKNISLSYYLMQLPWELIDYVLTHELVHTKHLNHSADFWTDFQKALPGAKALRKEMHAYKPRLKPLA